MKNKLILLSLFAMLLGACRTLHVGDFHNSNAMPERLPKLGLLVHERSFLEAFDIELVRDWAVSSGPYGPEPWFAYETTDQALEDVFHLFDNELGDNINQGAGPRYGHARFKLLHYNRRNPGWGWIIPSVGTLWTANLLGMPMSNIQSDVELQLEITDADGKMLVGYSAPGTGKAKVAMYYGYTSSQAVRKANLLALKDAMIHIKQKLAADVPMLTERLMAAGEVKRTSK
jgi:hypothetical protein